MNGEVNGTVEEAMDTSEPLVKSKTVKSEDSENGHAHSENSNGLEKNHITKSVDGVSQDREEKIKQELLADLSESNDSQVSQSVNPKSENKNDQMEQESKSPETHLANSNSTESTNQTEQKDQTKQKVVEKVQENKKENKNTENNGESDEEDSEEDSSDDDGVSEAPRRPQDTVSINSDSDSESDNNKEIIILDNEIRSASYNGSSCDAQSPEIHEILSDNDDDCIVTKDENTEKDSLRRSSRGIKTKRFDENFEVNGDDDGESDVEEVVLDDPLKKKLKLSLNSETKSAVDMAVKQTKTNQGNQKKDTSVAGGLNIVGKIVQTKNSQNASLKTVSVKTPNSTTAQPAILPSLTDDMFVVEAPSFIVPYVYEKPSMKPFREFVDILGRELEEQKAKEEKERLEKEKAEKEKRDKDRQERRDRGEEVSDDEKEKEAKKKKEEKRERRRRKKEDDDASWDGSASSSSEDEILSDEEEKNLALKQKLDSIEQVAQLAPDKLVANKSDNYFDCSLGKFFMNIGLNLVQEFVQTDLLKQQNRKLYREKKAGHSTKSTQTSIASLMKNLEFSKENNAPYAVKQKKCEFCSFKTESSLVMSNHLETPHMKNNMYKCNYCAFEIRSPHDILFHMEAEHNVRGKLERAPAYHQCANCPFEDNGKGKLARHLVPCAKKFKPEVNLAPPVEWEPPAKIPKITRARNNLTSPYSMGRGVAGVAAAGRGAAGAALAGALKARGRGAAVGAVRGGPQPAILRGGVTVRPAPPPGILPTNFGIMNNGRVGSKNHQPSISITPLPRQPPPSMQANKSQAQGGKASFVICEICDGYIKDLEQLRNHMQWIHKVKIHPKMIHNRPPLNCQKCQFRFFTDQGLERHLLGSHGLVTSSMQEAANKGKDAGRCPVCGRVYQWKLLAHVARDHKLTLKPAHLSYKCTVCTATFGMYKQFESHVYSAHSVVAKRVVEKGEVPSQSKGASTNNSLLKPVKINDEITITPQPAKTSSKTK